MAGVEVLRGSAEPEKRMWPGGAFDPMGLSKVRYSLFEGVFLREALSNSKRWPNAPR